MARNMTKKEIRDHLGHNLGNRRVRISVDGRVTYYGSTDDYDRTHDYWHEGGCVENYWIETEVGFEYACRI